VLIILIQLIEGLLPHIRLVYHLAPAIHVEFLPQFVDLVSSHLFVDLVSVHLALEVVQAFQVTFLGVVVNRTFIVGHMDQRQEEEIIRTN